MKLCIALTVAAFLVFPCAAMLQAQGNPMFGTFRLNVAKSKYDPGPPPKSETRIYERYGADGIKATFDRVDASGKQTKITYSALFDGKDYPLMGSPRSDTIALKRLGRDAFEATQKQGGKAVLTTKTVLSADGNTRTVTWTGINATGPTINNVEVFERQ
jgi:hypothetical protein